MQKTTENEPDELIPDLFRTEYSKLIAILCRQYSIASIELIEDAVSETFLAASETWGLKGVPKNPKGWLYMVAKNRIIQYFKREGLFQSYTSATLQSESAITGDEVEWNDAYIEDSQLRMMFAVCHPELSDEAQIALALRILCGFGIDEIAKAFLSNKENINKRLHRSKNKLKALTKLMDLPEPSQLNTRIDNVLRTIYLLFNEGYHSASDQHNLRKDLCLEALRLAVLMAHNELTKSPEVDALIALMCFHASRFDARTNEDEEWVLYEKQNRSLWDQDLIFQGEWYLNRSARGEEVSRYHLEAAIAYWHTRPDTKEKWSAILMQYNKLVQINHSEVLALNRTYALYRAEGREKALSEAYKLNLKQNCYYHMLIAELLNSTQASKAMEHYKKALTLTKSQSLTKLILHKIEDVSKQELFNKPKND